MRENGSTATASAWTCDLLLLGVLLPIRATDSARGDKNSQNRRGRATNADAEAQRSRLGGCGGGLRCGEPGLPSAGGGIVAATGGRFVPLRIESDQRLDASVVARGRESLRSGEDLLGFQEGGFAFGELALVLQQEPEVLQTAGDVRVPRRQRAAPDRQRLARQRLGFGKFALFVK